MLGPLRSHDKNASPTASGNGVSEWVNISVWALTGHEGCAPASACRLHTVFAHLQTLDPSLYPHNILLQYSLNSLLTQLVEWPINEMQRITKST